MHRSGFKPWDTETSPEFIIPCIDRLKSPGNTTLRKCSSAQTQREDFFSRDTFYEMMKYFCGTFNKTTTKEDHVL